MIIARGHDLESTKDNRNTDPLMGVILLCGALAIVCVAFGLYELYRRYHEPAQRYGTDGASADGSEEEQNLAPPNSPYSTASFRA